MNEPLKQIQASLGGHKVARRSVLVGAAWTVPAVVVGSAVPAWATGLSQEQPPVQITNVVCCKFSNQNVYHFELTFTNDQPQLYVELSNINFLLQPTSGTNPAMPVAGSHIFGPAGSATASAVLVVNSAVSTNSAAFQLFYNEDWVRSTSSTMSPVYDSGHYPTTGQWSPQVGTFNNTPDCSATKNDQYSALNTAFTATWV